MIDRLSVRERPSRTPVMHQTWQDLLFLHWKVDPSVLRPHVPAALEIDTWEGAAWIGVTPFGITGIRPTFLPAFPLVSESLELNVRTYVVHRGVPGVWFFSLDASNPLAVPAARLTFRLPYRHARMRMVGDRDGGLDFRSVRSEGPRPRPELDVRWTVGPALGPARPDTLEFYLVERYCLYARHDDALYRSRIHHRPWPLHQATVERLKTTMLQSQDLPQPAAPPHVLAQGAPLPVEIWPLERVGAT